MRILNGIMDCCSVLIVLTISTWAVINISWLVQYFTNLNIFEYPSSGEAGFFLFSAVENKFFTYSFQGD